MSDIDALLERYLARLDTYTSLQQELSRLQASMYSDIARANFSAERGFRYGRDSYDERMQANSRLTIHGQVPVFTVDASDEGDAKGKRHDPLRWFGILTPPALRSAQTAAIEAVQDVIPKLASVDAEMKSLEIEVRRARKKRAKAETAKAV